MHDADPFPSRTPSPIGRPKLDPDARRSRATSIRFSPEEQAAIEGLAAQAQLSVSAYLRAAALGTRITVRDEAVPAAVIAQLRRIGNNLNQVVRESRFNQYPPDVVAEAKSCIREIAKYIRRELHGESTYP